MRTLVILASGALLNGCALMGVYGPEAQQNAMDGLNRITTTAVQAGAAYEQGRAEGYQSYQPVELPPMAPLIPYQQTQVTFPSWNVPSLPRPATIQPLPAYNRF